MKCQAGWVTSWNQDGHEQYQQPQICKWYHSNGRKWRAAKSLLMRSKEESEKASLKPSIQNTKITAPSSITSWQIEGEKVEAVTDFPFLGSKITVDGDCSHEIKTLAPWKESCDKPRHCIKKQRYHLTNKSLYCQSYNFFRTLIWMWELIHKDMLCCA